MKLRNPQSVFRLGALLLLCAGTRVQAAPVPDSTFHGLDHAPHKLSSLRGHLAVVNFWATWCGPCREELPRLSHLQAAYGGRDAAFVVISLDEKKSWPEVAHFAEQKRLQIPVWTGATADTLDACKLRNVLPATLILDERGNVLRRVEGEARDTDIQEVLDWALGGKQGPAPEPLVKRD